MPVQERRYAGQTRAERDAQRRQRLLEASLQAFGTAGYAVARTDRICQTAKVSTSHFYKLYANKEALFLDVYDQISAQSFHAAAKALAASEGRPVQERIPDAFLAYVRPLIGDRRKARIAMVEILGVSPAIEARRQHYREALVTVVESTAAPAVARGDLTDRDFRFATFSLAGAANAVIYDWLITREGRGDAAELETKLAHLSLALLGG